jgi:hypothetical protein
MKVRYRIVELQDHEDIWYEIQKKNWFWWETVTEENIDITGSMFTTTVQFDTVEKAEEYVMTLTPETMKVIKEIEL